jgi:hypothetical protein
MTEAVQVEGTTEARVDAQTQATVENKNFTQEQLDRIVADRLARERSKWEKQYEGVDPSRYRELAAEEENRRIEAMKKREEFDTILKETVSKKDQQVEQLRREIHSVKVEGSLLNEASRNRAINPNQVVQLLRDKVKLNEVGGVEVVDDHGQVRYKDSGDPYGVEDLVNEFLSSNPHFVNANSSGSGISSKTQPLGDQRVDITQLDMSNPKHRELYKKYRSQI